MTSKARRVPLVTLEQSRSYDLSEPCVPVTLPGPDTRWRCGVCGNLTRFDVTRLVRSREYVHVDLAGVPVVEELKVLAETVEHVTCRWCGALDNVVLEPRPASG